MSACKLNILEFFQELSKTAQCSRFKRVISERRFYFSVQADEEQTYGEQLVVKSEYKANNNLM